MSRSYARAKTSRDVCSDSCSEPSARASWEGLWSRRSRRSKLAIRKTARSGPALPPAIRGDAFPGVKGARERVQLFEAEEERDLARVEIRAREQSARSVAANVVEEHLIARPELAEPPLQRARAHSHRARDRL